MRYETKIIPITPQILMGKFEVYDYSREPTFYLPEEYWKKLKSFGVGEKNPAISYILETSRESNLSQILLENFYRGNMLLEGDFEKIIERIKVNKNKNFYEIKKEISHYVKDFLGKGISSVVIFNDNMAGNAEMPMWIGASRMEIFAVLKINLFSI